jgi:hypothetical protein
MNVEQEIRELKAQLAAALKRIADLEGSFGYISNQLRDVQRFLQHGARLPGRRAVPSPSRLSLLSIAIGTGGLPVSNESGAMHPVTLSDLARCYGAIAVSAAMSGMIL